MFWRFMANLLHWDIPSMLYHIQTVNVNDYSCKMI